MPIYKVEAQDDVLYIKANTQTEADAILIAAIGPLPGKYLGWSSLDTDTLPEGAELLNAPASESTDVEEKSTDVEEQPNP